MRTQARYENKDPLLVCVCVPLRVVEMSGRCNDILLSSAKNKVSYYLQQALDELNIHLETACNKYQGEWGREGS